MTDFNAPVAKRRSGPHPPARIFFCVAGLHDRTGDEDDEVEAEAERLSEAATEGPWVFATDKGAPQYVQLYSIAEIDEYEADVLCADGSDVLVSEADAAFIAWSRTGVPALLAALRQFREENDRQATLIAGLAARRHELVSELEARRLDLGLTQTEVAARMGTSQPAVARLESGVADIRLSTLERYAAALSHELEWHLKPMKEGT